MACVDNYSLHCKMYFKSFAHLYKHTQDLETASSSHVFLASPKFCGLGHCIFGQLMVNGIFIKKKRSQTHPPIDFFASIKTHPEVIVPSAMWEKEKVGVIQWHQALQTAVKSILACFSASCYREIKCMA